MKSYLPAQIARDSKSKRTIVKRWKLYKSGHRYKITSERLPVAPDELRDYRRLKAKHREVERLLLSMISRGTLKGIISLPYHPYVAADQSVENIFRAQCDIVFCTAYVGIQMPGGLYYGVVMFPRAAIKKIIQSRRVHITNIGYLRPTQEIDRAYVDLLQRLQKFSQAWVAERRGNVNPQFIVNDFMTTEANAALATLSNDERLRGGSVAPDTARRLIRKALPTSDYFPKKEGGRTNRKRRDETKSLLQSFWPSIDAGADEDASEEVETVD